MLGQKKEIGMRILYHYSPQRDKYNFQFAENGQWNVSLISDRNELESAFRDPKLVYIVDATEPEILGGTSILISSPNTQIAKKYRKERHKKKVFPIWTLEELIECGKICYPDLPLQSIMDIHSLCGGIPRYIFEFTFLEVSELINNTVQRSDLSKCIQIVNSEDTEDAFSYKLIHVTATDNDFIKTKMLFASPWAEEIALQFYWINCRTKLTDMIKSMPCVPEIAVFHGHIFERIAHKILTSAQSLKVRNLESDDEFERTFSDSPHAPRQFNADKELQNFSDHELAVPVSGNYPSIDSLMKPNKLFQCTISKNHSIKGVGLERVHKQLQNQDYEFYFCVPDYNFGKIKCQKIKNKDKSERQKALSFRIRQFAIAIPFGEHVTLESHDKRFEEIEERPKE